MDLGPLHWLRPMWLWALLLLPAWIWLAARHARRATVWDGVVDAHLQPHVLASSPAPMRRHARWMAAMAYVMAVIALSGPAWRQAPQPSWRQSSPLVMALDLSSAINLRDLPPSRLAQARAKLATLLRQREGGQVALVAYAGDAFTVAPLTDDAANVALYLDALASDVMPVDGQRIDRAIVWSTRLLQRAGFSEGDILVMGARATPADIAAAGVAASGGARVSVLGVGSMSGGTPGAFDETSLRQLARVGGGHYRRITLDDADLRGLGVLEPRGAAGAGERTAQGRQWLDEGFWLLPVVLLLLLPAFRRGATLVVVAVVCALPVGTTQANEWWRRPDQVRHAAMEAAARQYRQGDFEGAARGFAQGDSADAHYNRGNALAKSGRYAEAIEAYDEALERAPGMADAQANRRAVQAAMKRRPPAGGKPGAGSPSGAGKPAGSASSTGAGQRGAQTSGTSAGQPPLRRGQQTASGRDATTQAEADAAQRARMRQALAERSRADRQGGKGAPTPTRGESAAQRERRMANEAWLQRVPDDPGGLLREKFRLEHERRMQQGGGAR